MKLFYKAVTDKGKTISGFLEAKDSSEAAVYLRSKNLFPVKIIKNEKSSILSSVPFVKEKVSASELTNFTRQLSSMLTSGITFSRSLEILKEQAQSGAMANILDGIIVDVREGGSFSYAISRHPETFSPIYIAFVEASEGSGLLDKALARLALTLEKQQKLRSSVKAALFYPAIVITGMIIVTFIVMVFLIPQLSTIYESLGNELPWSTKILMAISNFFVSFWYIAIGLLIAMFYLFRRWHATIEGKLTIDSILLKLPIFGEIIKISILAELSRTLGALLKSGTLVVDALKKVSDITGNIHYKNAIIEISRKVEKGVSIGDAMNLFDLFPPNLIELVRTGEQTGKMDETLIKASEYFENEVDEKMKTLSTAIGPIILLVLGIGVALLLFAIITPIYQMMDSIQ